MQQYGCLQNDYDEQNGQHKKCTYSMIPFTWYSRTGKLIYTDKSEMLLPGKGDGVDLL